jgi:hypothetical protein
LLQLLLELLPLKLDLLLVGMYGLLDFQYLHHFDHLIVYQMVVIFFGLVGMALLMFLSEVLHHQLMRKLRMVITMNDI